jgi:protein-L-isoaspartate O-methyltransferase
MAQMLEDLRPSLGLHVLEIGTGTGYNAALLSHVVGADRVLSVDVDRQVLAEAREHLAEFPERRVRLVHADGRDGFAEAAPFERIMVTAATPDLEPAWLEQLHPGGVLLAPLALAPGLAFIVCGTVLDGIFEGRLTRPAYFMPLRTEGDIGDGDPPGPSISARFQRIPAPWAEWFDRRRRRLGWYALGRSLAFFGLLRGLEVGYQMVEEDRPTFLLTDPGTEAACWLGDLDWHISGDAGRRLGEELWRSFLDAGGPWPTEFRVRAAARGQLGLDAPPGSHTRYGPRCRQVWELIEPRDRPAPT